MNLTFHLCDAYCWNLLLFSSIEFDIFDDLRSANYDCDDEDGENDDDNDGYDDDDDVRAGLSPLPPPTNHSYSMIINIQKWLRRVVEPTESSICNVGSVSLFWISTVRKKVRFGASDTQNSFSCRVLFLAALRPGGTCCPAFLWSERLSPPAHLPACLPNLSDDQTWRGEVGRDIGAKKGLENNWHQRCMKHRRYSQR